MSRYATSRVLYDVTRDAELAERFRTDPDAVLDGRGLTAEEREAVRTADLRTLLTSGVHPFVLYHFALRLNGGFSMPFMQGYLGQIQGLTVGDLET